jgi:hypothetical protein
MWQVRRGDRYRQCAARDPSNAVHRRIRSQPSIRDTPCLARERPIRAVQDADLCFGLRQTRAHGQEPRPGFLWGFRAAVHEPDDLAQLHQPADTGVALNHCVDVGDLQPCCVSERVEANQRSSQPFSSSEIGSGSSRRCYGHPAHRADFLVAEVIAVDDDAVDGRLTVLPVEFSGSSGSIHRAPCSAAADRPARAARRPDHSHAATARLTAVTSWPFST